MHIRRALAGWVSLILVASSGMAGAQDRRDTPESLRAEAFEAAQWAIASDAADALAKVSARFAQGDDALGQLAERRETLITRRDQQERELERLYSVEGPEGQTRRAETRTAYEQTLTDLRAADAQIEATFPAYSELTSPRALTVQEAQGLLREDEGLLLVLVNPEATYVWGVSRRQDRHGAGGRRSHGRRRYLYR